MSPSKVSRHRSLSGAVDGRKQCHNGRRVGINGLSFQSPDTKWTGPVDWVRLHPTFLNAEAGADTAKPNRLRRRHRSSDVRVSDGEGYAGLALGEGFNLQRVVPLPKYENHSHRANQ